MASVNYGELAKTANKDFEPLPPDIYAVEVSGAEHKVSKNGNPFYALTLSVSDGPHKGRKLWTNVTLNAANPGSVGYFFGTMRNLGLDADFFAGLPDEDSEAVICQALVGRRVNVTVKHREYQGKIQNEVDKISSSGATVAPVAATTPDVTTATPAAAPDLPPGL